ncbi:MFS transporter [Alteromonas confluentis]|nr:MFS transporter [Alteromonas confluentis]
MSSKQATTEQVVRPPHGLTSAKLVLGMGGLAIGTGEFAAMGLLPSMADTFNISVSEAGYGVIAYAFGVVIGGPFLAVLTAHLPRQRVLIGLLAIVLAGNLATALAPEMISWLTARFISGIPHGTYYGIASLVAASMVPENQRATAIGQVMLGLAVANLLGVPFSTWLGQVAGWETTFLVISAIALVTLALTFYFIPFVTGDKAATPMKELSVLKQADVWATLLVATIGFAGMFSLYSYITPSLQNLTGMAESTVPWMLMAWGAGMVIGNVVGGKCADSAMVPSLYGILIWNALFLAAFAFFATDIWSSAILLFLIGCGFALVPALQSRLMDVASNAQSLGATLNHSAFNLSNALGAWLGGIALSVGFGWESPAIVGAVLAAIGVPVLALSLLLAKSKS